MTNEHIYDSGKSLAELFSIKKPIIATLHLLSLPGAPFYKGQCMDDLLAYTLSEVQDLVDAGIDGLIVENHGDIPFVKPDGIGYETVAAMTYIAGEVQRYVSPHGIPIGINCLANGALPALAVAKAVGAKFVRINQFVNAYVANEGFVEGLAGEVLRYRANIRGEDIAIFADVHVKHGSHSIVADRTVREQAKDALFFCADVLVCTGSRTGSAPDEAELKEIKVNPDTAVVVGSGTTIDNVTTLMKIADGAIVASHFKEDGVWNKKVARDRVMRFMDRVREIRQQPT